MDINLLFSHLACLILAHLLLLVATAGFLSEVGAVVLNARAGKLMAAIVDRLKQAAEICFVFMIIIPLSFN